MGVREVKTEIRQRVKKARDALSPQQKAELDEKVYKAFINTLSYNHSRSLILNVSRGDEVDTLRIIEKALDDKKKVAVPRCVPQEVKLDFFEIKALSDLIKGHYGILEPSPELCKKIDPFEYDLCVVPGLCFDKEGYRLGFGKGYYDRFLEHFKGVKAGLAYSFLIEKYLPRGRYDKRVEIIITEKGVRRVENP